MQHLWKFGAINIPLFARRMIVLLALSTVYLSVRKRVMVVRYDFKHRIESQSSAHTYCCLPADFHIAYPADLREHLLGRRQSCVSTALRRHRVCPSRRTNRPAGPVYQPSALEEITSMIHCNALDATNDQPPYLQIRNVELEVLTEVVLLAG